MAQTARTWATAKHAIQQAAHAQQSEAMEPVQNSDHLTGLDDENLFFVDTLVRHASEGIAFASSKEKVSPLLCVVQNATTTTFSHG